MKRKAIFLTFKVLPFLLLGLLILSSLLISGCSPLDIIFGPSSGSLLVETYPSGAKVFLNGNDTGEITPCTMTNLNKGSYEITVTYEDKSYTEEIIVYPGNTASIYKDLLPRLEEIIIKPDFLYTTIGETRDFSTITAYYFDLDHLPAVIKLDECTYTKDNGYANINSEEETFTGVSKGQTKVIVSYTERDFTRSDIVDIFVCVSPTPPPGPGPEPGPDGALQANVVITKLEQSLNYAYVYYEIENTGSIDIDFYQIWFTVKCTDNSEYTDWTAGLDLKVGDKRNDYGLVDVGEKTAESVTIKNWELK